MCSSATPQKATSNDGALTPRNLRECEAEAVAMRCCAALGLPGVEFGGTYIRHWWGAGKIPRRSAQRIQKAVDQILRRERPRRRLTRIDRERATM